MKILRFTLTLLIVCLCSCLSAQDIPDPDFTLRPYYFNGNTLASLEVIDATSKSKMKALGYGGSDIFYTALGEKSSVRFPSSALPRIILKMEDGSDPSEIFTLLSGEIKKNDRIFKTGKMSGLVPKFQASENRIKISFKKIRDKVFEIAFDQPLAPGEYAIQTMVKGVNYMSMPTIKLPCFGID